MKRYLAFVSALAVSGAVIAPANAAVLSCTTLAPPANTSCVPFASPPSAVGNNNQNIPNTIQYFAENTVVGPAAIGSLTFAPSQAVASDYFVFDPPLVGLIRGTATFSGTVLGVISTRSGLIASNPVFGLPGVTYNTPIGVALEPVLDSISFSGNTVNFRLLGGFPSDSFRVLTAAPAVPEPATWAMMLMGFGLIGYAMRRRRRMMPASFA